MSQITFPPVTEPFVDRREYRSTYRPGTTERRQFTDSHEHLSDEARELALAIDEYKLLHRRRFITYEEVLQIVKSLGYSKPE
jgi:hypothetical protein